MSTFYSSVVFASLVIVISLFSKCCHSQVLGAGFCPRLYGMYNFNVTKYQGQWYEVEKYWMIPEASSVCINTFVTDKHDGTFLSEINFYEQLTMKKWKVTALNRYKPEYNTASFIMEMYFSQFPVPFGVKLPWIMLDTDYASYAVHFYCRTLGPVNLQGLWILSRTKTLGFQTRNHIYRKLAFMGLDVNRLKPTDQTACPP